MITIPIGVTADDVSTMISTQISDIDISMLDTSMFILKTDIQVDSEPRENSQAFVTSDGIWTKNNTQDTDFTKHRDTDVFRWTDTYEEQYNALLRYAIVQGLKPLNGVFGAALYPYTVSAEYGGIFRLMLHNNLDTDANVYYINGVEVYNTSGLPAGPNMNKYVWLNKGDVITHDGGTSLAAFMEFVPDPSSNIAIIVANLSAQISLVKSQVLAIQASVANKKLDPTNQVNIETQTQSSGYTVTTALGGQIYFESPLVLLLGVGTVYINGVSAWSNVSLTVGLGVTSDTLEVQAGDVITTSGVSKITFTPYIGA